MLPVVLAIILAAELPQQTPVRDAPATPTSGTASVSGVVVNDETRPQPVRRAVVTLTGAELRPSRGAVTDDEGRFSFATLPAGRFTLTVSRATYITSSFGAKRPGRPGTPIAVAEGASVTGLSVKLWRGAVIAGIVRDDSGQPRPNIPVNVISSKPGPVPLLSLTNNGVLTNEQGEFRIFGIEPGVYVVAAQPSSGGSQILAMRDAEVDAALDAARRRSASTPTAPPPSPRPFDYAPVYYPNAIAISQATPLNLSAGQTLEGIDLTIQRVFTSVVSGVVRRADGAPVAGAAVQLAAEAPPGPFSSAAAAMLDATTGADGSFRIVQVVPGTYQLIARAAAAPPPPGTPGLISPGPVGPQLWAATPLTVGGSDVEGVSLTVEPGLNISGRVVFESDTRKAPAMTGIRLSLVPPSVMTSPGGTAVRTIAFIPGITVTADGQFRIPSVPPGTFRLVVSSGSLQPASTWVLKSALLGERDLLDADFQILERGEAAMTLTFTDKQTELSGSLSTTSGAPASDVFVIAYAADRKLWGSGARRVQAVRPGIDGRYAIKGLPPGDYLLAAVLDIDPNDWNDPVFLEQLVPASIKLSLGDGEQKTQDLRIR